MTPPDNQAADELDWAPDFSQVDLGSLPIVMARGNAGYNQLAKYEGMFTEPPAMESWETPPFKALKEAINTRLREVIVSGTGNPYYWGSDNKSPYGRRVALPEWLLEWQCDGVKWTSPEAQVPHVQSISVDVFGSSQRITNLDSLFSKPINDVLSACGLPLVPQDQDETA